MSSNAPPSPPWTQNAPIDYPLEKLRSWLFEHGVSAPSVDRLWTKYNQRQHNFDPTYPFLAIIKDIVIARKIEFATPTDLDHIATDCEHATRNRNAQLQKESDDAVSEIFLDTTRLLPEELRHDFLNFLKSDSMNARNQFLATVLPWMSRNLKRKRSKESADDFCEESKQPQSKRARVNQRKIEDKSAREPRRSKRIAAKQRK